MCNKNPEEQSGSSSSKLDVKLQFQCRLITELSVYSICEALGLETEPSVVRWSGMGNSTGNENVNGLALVRSADLTIRQQQQWRNNRAVKVHILCRGRLNRSSNGDIIGEMGNFKLGCCQWRTMRTTTMMMARASNRPSSRRLRGNGVYLTMYHNSSDSSFSSTPTLPFPSSMFSASGSLSFAQNQLRRASNTFVNKNIGPRGCDGEGP